MSEKNNKSNGEQQQKKDGTESKKKESGGSKGGNVTVVLKANLHCEGCVSKVLKCIRTFDGVDTANIGDGQITVIGKVDPVKLRERVEKKTHKKVEVISPQTNKNGNGKQKEKGRENAGAGDAKKEEKKKEPHEKNTNNNKCDEKKSKEKEPPITTAVLKVHLHCEGCIQKIRRIVVKTKGYRDMKIDKQKEMVTVTGALDMKALAEVLKKHLKRDVQIVPQKKEAEKKENSGGAKGGGGDKGKSGGGGGGGGGDGGVKTGGSEKMEGNNNKMQFQVAHPHPDPYPYPIVYESGVAVDQLHYNPYAFGPNHAPQLFSDENPNACCVM